MAVSIRTVARECLNLIGAVSVQRHILALRELPPPRSLRDELNFIQRNRCPPKAPTGLRVTNVADRKISVAWTDQSSNEDGFSIQFLGKSAGPPITRDRNPWVATKQVLPWKVYGAITNTRSVSWHSMLVDNPLRQTKFKPQHRHEPSVFPRRELENPRFSQSRGLDSLRVVELLSN